MAQGGQVLVTLNLPAGSYALLGRVEIGQSSYSDNEFVGICDLTAGSDSDHVILQGTGTTSVGSTFEIRMATMSVLHTFPSPGSATISCGTTVPAPASGGNARITAVQVPGRACLRERHAVGGPRLGVVDRAQSNPALKVPI